MATSSGKKRKLLAGNAKDIFRLIQSIPSKKAEPFKLWLTQVGKVLKQIFIVWLIHINCY
jgi:prophage antirepressor-like protein